jgi:AraC-like DNA-binding protein
VHAILRGSGSSFVTEIGDYAAILPASVTLLPIAREPFRARLTWVALPRVKLLRARETSSRVAFMNLPLHGVTISFLLDAPSTLIYGGRQIGWGDISFHAPGEKFHQQTASPCSWGAVCLSEAELRRSARVLAGEEITIPSLGRILRLRPEDHRCLLEMHAQAARVMKRNPESICHPQVARALNEDLLWALVAALENATLQDDRRDPLTCTELLLRLEAELADAPELRTVDQISRRLRVPRYVLQTCCARILGMSAGRYASLKRLALMRRALSGSHGSGDDLLHAARFRDFEHFAAAYRLAFGTNPALDIL